MWIKVETVKHLKVLAANETKEFAIALQGGLIARKLVQYNTEDNIFYVDDLVTGCDEEYTEEELAKETNIVNAIKSGAFYLEEI